MKSVVRLTLIIAICFMALALLPAPVEAVCRDPAIELKPNRGVPGDTVTINGKDFDPNEYVDIYFYIDSSARILLKEGILWSSGRNFQVTVTIPESPAGVYTIRAEGRVDGEVEEQDANLTVVPGLTVSPEKGAIGSSITVKGYGFAENETGIEVRHGPYDTIAGNIQADASGTWEAMLEVPAWSRGEQEIRARGSKTVLVASVRPAFFEVTPGIRLDEPWGRVGSSTGMSGSGFDANERNIRILLDGYPVTTGIRADDTGRWQATFQVPELPAGRYSVTADGDRTRQRDVGELDFEIGALLVLSPGEGHAGMNLTATGHGFPAGKTVVILYEGDEVAQAASDDEGSFDVTFAVPESRHGEREVEAAVSEGTNSVADLKTLARAYFVMESDPPPTPELRSPEDGSRAGFFPRTVTPTFEWSQVFDESGVYYDLIVATDPEFDTDSVLVAVTGLTSTSYTLNEDQGLPGGTYYWTVRAVDGAENEGRWSEAHAFRTGRMPLWAFIVVFSFVGLLLVLRAYFILVRPRLYD